MVEKLGASSLLHFHRRSIKYLSIHYLFQAIHHPRCTFCTLTSGGCFFFQLCPGCCSSAFSFMVSVYHCQTGRLVCNVSMILVHTAPSVSVLFFFCACVSEKPRQRAPSHAECWKAHQNISLMSVWHGFCRENTTLKSFKCHLILPRH